MNKDLIVGISGKIGAGKTTLAEVMVNSMNFNKFSFAAALKKDVESLCKARINSSVKHLFRPLLQSYGQIMRELYGDDYWVKRLLSDIEYYQCLYTDKEPLTVIDDVRYISEIKTLRNSGYNTFIIRLLIKPELQSYRHNQTYGYNLTEEAANHVSETELDSYSDFDMLLPANITTEAQITLIREALVRRGYSFPIL